jgi:hypothetical protein
MQFRPSASYSQLTLLRLAFEYELNNVLKFEDRQEFFRVIQYLQERIEQIKEDEKKCLKIQGSSKK